MTNIAFNRHPVAVLNELSINATTCDLGGYHISYNPSSRDYGCKTTAIVLKGRVFLILNGDHREAIKGAIIRGGLLGAIEYFIDNAGQANALSEHLMVAGIQPDIFNLRDTVIEMVGQSIIDRMAERIERKQNR